MLKYGLDDDRWISLRRWWTGCIVTVDASRPELARWKKIPGRVVAVNRNGRALVQFEGVDLTWYDIEPEFLTIVEPAPSTRLS